MTLLTNYVRTYCVVDFEEMIVYLRRSFGAEETASGSRKHSRQLFRAQAPERQRAAVQRHLTGGFTSIARGVPNVLRRALGQMRSACFKRFVFHSSLEGAPFSADFSEHKYSRAGHRCGRHLGHGDRKQFWPHSGQQHSDVQRNRGNSDELER